MTNDQIKNATSYVLIAVAMAVLATGVQLGAVLSGTGEILWRPLAATFVTTLFGTLATAGATALRPRVGREDISHLVSTVGPGPAKAVLENEVIRQETGALPVPVATDLADQIVTKIREQMETAPSGEGARKYIRDVPFPATFVHRGEPPPPEMGIPHG